MLWLPGDITCECEMSIEYRFNKNMFKLIKSRNFYFQNNLFDVNKKIKILNAPLLMVRYTRKTTLFFFHIQSICNLI
jgi:hypothetical protein